MFNRKTLCASVALVAAIVSGTAAAQGGAFADPSSPGDTYTRMEFIPGWMKSMVSSAEVRAGIAKFQMNPISMDGRYRFVGGESGWELIPPMYESVGGTMKRMPAMRGTAADFNNHYQMFNPSSGS